MRGSQLTIYAANQSHRVRHRSVVDWILEEAKNADIHGATVVEVAEGVDDRGKYHAARFFELAEQSVAVTLIAEDAQIDDLLERLNGGGVHLFYTRARIEYAALGTKAAG